MNRLLRLVLAFSLFGSAPAGAWAQARVSIGAAQASPAGLMSPAAVFLGLGRTDFSASGPRYQPALPPTDFSLTPERIQALYQAAEDRFAAKISAIVALPAEQRTFASVVKALEQAQAEFSNAIDPASFLTAVGGTEELRAAAEAMDRRTSTFMIALAARTDVYQAHLDAAAKNEALPEQDRRLLEDAIQGYQKSGMALPAERRAELARARKRLSDIALEFESNLQKVSDGVDATRKELAGLSEAFINELPRGADGAYRIGLKGSEYTYVMEQAQSAELRRRLEFKYNNRAADKNVALVEEALALRHQVAKTLGYETFADLAIEDRMAQTKERVFAFLERLRGLVAGAARQDLDRLLERKRRDEPGATALHNWERAYYRKKLELELYGVDGEEIRQYFPIATVIEGTLGVYQELLGLRFQEIEGPKWHSDVRLFVITDAADGRLLGHFYLDLHPRPGKHDHPTAYTIVQGHERADGSYQRPVAAMVAGFTKPTKDAPSLLSHDEVETFFHEFGHIMHQTLTTAQYYSYAGSRTARDFVEAPSQMMENFVWQPEVLNRLSGHWQDPSRKLPKELLDKMLGARRFNVALDVLIQIGLASIDMAFHTATPPVDTSALMALVRERVGMPPPTPGTHFQAGFGHLMGYAAGYYGYLWSKVFAQDIFSRFEKEGILNPAVGRAYRQAILERGSSVDEDQLLRDFLGREPNEDAFLRSLGITLPNA